jgi:hypothetical protein
VRPSPAALFATFVTSLIDGLLSREGREQPPEVVTIVELWESTSRGATAKAMKGRERCVFFVESGTRGVAQPRARATRTSPSK